MSDPRDFLALCRFAVPGIILIGLGLSGVFVHRNRMRCATSFCVALAGCQLALIGAAAFQRTTVPITLTGTVFGTGAVAFLVARRQRESDEPDRTDNDSMVP